MDFNWIDALLEPTEYDVYDVTLKNDAEGPVIVVDIEKRGYISLDDCVQVSRLINDALEVSPLNTETRVEVASAGAERALKTLTNYQNATGKTAAIKTEDGTFNGTIQSVNETTIELALKKETKTLLMSDVLAAHLTIVF